MKQLITKDTFLPDHKADSGKTNKLLVDDTGELISVEDTGGGGGSGGIEFVSTENTSDIEHSGNGTASSKLKSVISTSVKNNIQKGVTAESWGDHADAGYLTQHQDISGKEDKSNKVTNLLNPNHTTYPTTKAITDAIINIDPVPDAPQDGKTYGRKDGAWEEIIQGGGGGIINIFKDYDDITQLLADQANQSSNRIYKVIDASLDANITFPSGETKLHAYYEYKETPNSDIDDYTLISAPFADGSGGIDLSTGLEAIDEGNGIGWRLKGRNPAGLQDIGLGAIDFTEGSGSTNSYGASGDRSFSVGQLSRASGENSIAMGRNASAVGQGSVALSESTSNGNRSFSANLGVADGELSTALGWGKAIGKMSFAHGWLNKAYSYLEASFGIHPIEYTPISTTSWQPLDRIFNIGVGTGEGATKNAFTVLKNGMVTISEQTVALINIGGNRSIATKEYVDRKEIKTISDDTYTLLETDNNKILNFTSATDVTITVPAGLTVGNRYEGKQRGDGQLIFVGDTGVTVNVGASETNKTLEKFSVWGLDCCDIDEYDLFGKLELI